MSDKVLFPNFTENTKDYNSAQIQELNDVKLFLKIGRFKYKKYKTLHDALQELSTNTNNLDTEQKMKMQNILLSHSCAQVLSLDNENLINQDSLTLLGISDIINTTLNYSESAKLKKAVVTVLQQKYQSVCEEFFKITRKNIHDALSPVDDSLDFNLTTNDRVAFEYKEKLNEQQKQYLQNLLQEHEILNDIAKLRLECLPNMCNDKIKECQIKSQMNVLRTRIVKEKTRINIFTETDHSLCAYEELMKDIKEQQEECRTDIEHLKKLREKYVQVTCKQFHDLLKSYIQYKTSLEKKKQIYESLTM